MVSPSNVIRGLSILRLRLKKVLVLNRALRSAERVSQKRLVSIKGQTNHSAGSKAQKSKPEIDHRSQNRAASTSNFLKHDFY
jgi:hypothetical protein